MSELKVFYSPDGEHTKSYYLKSEADKVITELEESHKKEVEQLLIEIEELKKQVHDYAQGLYVMQARAEKESRHHKYKRCLDKAKWCESEENRLEAIAPLYDTDKECWEYNSDYWVKWHDHWLSLAEKFKPAKERTNERTERRT